MTACLLTSLIILHVNVMCECLSIQAGVCCVLCITPLHCILLHSFTILTRKQNHRHELEQTAQQQHQQ